MIDSLGILVSELKKKNCNMKVCVSLLTPRIESGLISRCIKELNEEIVKWTSNDNIHHAETEVVFKDNKNITEKSCYIDNGEHQGSLLNRTGVVRLLEAWCVGRSGFSTYVNWEKVKENTGLILASDHRSTYNSDQKHHNTASHNPPPSHTHIPPDDGWRVVTRGRGHGHNNRREQEKTTSTSLGGVAGYSHGNNPAGQLRRKWGQVTRTPALPPGGRREEYQHTSP